MGVKLSWFVDRGLNFKPQGSLVHFSQNRFCIVPDLGGVASLGQGKGVIVHPFMHDLGRVGRPNKTAGAVGS